MLPVFFSPLQLKHDPQKEMSDGQLIEAVETPSRVQSILRALEVADFVEIRDVKRFGRQEYARVHSEDYLSFLETFWAQWMAAGRNREAFPFVWPTRDFRSDVVPEHIDGKLGRFSFDAGTPLTNGTWEAAKASADTALSAARCVSQGAPMAFGLCRPPGHHAGRDYFGGYSFLNNAAIAAEDLRSCGADRVSILDIDYHHGNGTQAIFYHRGDVQFQSIHADPKTEYPYFLGHADELGTGDGEGANRNYPLPFGTKFESWMAALELAIGQIAAFESNALVISFGADIFEDDPISQFKIQQNEFAQIGERLAQVDVPTVVLMEGGYAVDALGINVVEFLRGLVRA